MQEFSHAQVCCFFGSELLWDAVLRRLHAGLQWRLFVPVLVDDDERAKAGHAGHARDADAACAADKCRQPVSDVFVSTSANVLPVVW